PEQDRSHGHRVVGRGELAGEVGVLLAGDPQAPHRLGAAGRLDGAHVDAPLGTPRLDGQALSLAREVEDRERRGERDAVLLEAVPTRSVADVVAVRGVDRTDADPEGAQNLSDLLDEVVVGATDLRGARGS